VIATERDAADFKEDAMLNPTDLTFRGNEHLRRIDDVNRHGWLRGTGDDHGIERFANGPGRLGRIRGWLTGRGATGNATPRGRGAIGYARHA
jgi:hypothetical protein